jgi:hypothetical protein
VGENNLALNLPLNPTKLMHDSVTKFVLPKGKKEKKELEPEHATVT